MMNHIIAREDAVYGTDFKELVSILNKLKEEEKDFVCAGASMPDIVG
jgi:hypothetical protein